MSDPTNEQLYDEPGPTPALAPEDHAMSAVDAALAPVLGRLRADMGPVNTATLIHVVNSIRQAMAHVVYGAPDPVEITGESLDIAGLQRRHGTAYRAYVEQCKADGNNSPDDLPTWVAAQREDPANGEHLTAAELATDDPLAAYDADQGAAQTRANRAAAMKLFA